MPAILTFGMLRGLGPVSLLAFAFLAGCAGSPDGAERVDAEDCELEPVLCDPSHYLAGHHCITNNVHPRIYAPDTPGPDSEPDPWRQGDYWEYDLTVDGDTEATSLVYYDDADFSGGRAEHYMVGVPNREEALDHALFSINPMLGRIHRSLYSPHESGVHADMFYFPLCEGSTWTTTFYDTRFDLRAERATLELPDGQADTNGFVISGEASDGSKLRHTYSPIAKWFTEIQVELDGGTEVSMVLTDFGDGRNGRMEFLRAQNDETVEIADVGADGTDVVREEGGEGEYDFLGLWLDVQRTSGDGRVEVHLRNPAGASAACVGFAGSGPTGGTECPSGPLKLELPWQPGVWTVTVERDLLDPDAQVAGTARIVDIYDRGGTV
jgi:hypothetical protein